MVVGLVTHERMYEPDKRKPRPRRNIANRGPATIGVPAENLAGKLHATYCVRASRKLHATRWHLENVCSSSRVEHIRPFEEVRERLTILAIANEAEASRRRYLVRDAVHVAAPAPKRELYGHTCLVIACEHLSVPWIIRVCPELGAPDEPIQDFKILSLMARSRHSRCVA